MFEDTDIKIIETHQHLGPCMVFDLNITKNDLTEAIDKNNIDICLVQLLPGVHDYREKNDDIIELCKEFEGKFYGLININPHLPEKEFDDEVKRLMDTGYFKAIKLHTIGHAVNPLSSDAEKVYRSAREYDMPVMVHTGAGIPFALPSFIIPKAQEYEDLNFILAHSGMGQIYSTEAYIVASVCSNVFLETSWTSIEDKNFFISALGSERLMFGADVPSNIPVELFQYKSLDLARKDIENIMYNNAQKLLKI